MVIFNVIAAIVILVIFGVCIRVVSDFKDQGHHCENCPYRKDKKTPEDEL